MITLLRRCGWLVLVGTFSCGEGMPGQTVLANGVGHEGHGRGGFITVDAVAVECDPTASQATAQLSGRLRTHGRGLAGDIVARVDHGAAVSVAEISRSAWHRRGHHRVAPFQVSLSLAGGTHDVKLCFVERGWRGRSTKRRCAAPVDVVVHCEQSGGGSVVNPPDPDPGTGGGGPACAASQCVPDDTVCWNEPACSPCRGCASALGCGDPACDLVSCAALCAL